MAGKKHRQNNGNKVHTSKGIHSSVSAATRSGMKAMFNTEGQRMLNQHAALRAGKDVVISIKNPDSSQKDKPFIRKRISAKTYHNRIAEKLQVHNLEAFA